MSLLNVSVLSLIVQKQTACSGMILLHALRTLSIVAFILVDLITILGGRVIQCVVSGVLVISLVIGSLLQSPCDSSL